MPPVIFAGAAAALSTGLAIGFTATTAAAIVASTLIASAAPGLNIAIDPPQGERHQAEERS